MIPALKKTVDRKSLVQSEITKEILALENETKYQKVTNYIRAIAVRAFFLTIICFYIYYLVSFSNSYYYIFMIIGEILIIMDGLYIVLKRRGKEPSW